MPTANFTSSFDNDETLYGNLTVTHIEHKHYTDTTINIFKILYVSVFVIGMIGNLLTSTSMVITQRLKRAVDIYTFNLAICDILILCFYIPTQIVFISDQLDWRMGIEMCKIVNVILPVTLTCTIGCLLAITLDRARSLAQPLKWRTDSVRSAKIVQSIIWAISILVNIPLFIFPKLIIMEEVTICTEGWPEYHHGEIFWVILFALMYCIPVFVMVIAYIVMGICIGKVNKALRDVHKKYHKRMVIMGIKLVAVFAICTGFQHYFFFITSSFSTVRLSTSTLYHLYGISNWFVSLQAAINPYIYGNMRQILKRGAPTDSNFWSSFLDNYKTVKRRLTILSLLPNQDNSEEANDTIKPDNLNPLENGYQNIETLLNPKQFEECIHSFPCVFDVEEYSVTQMIYYGLYIQKDNPTELATTYV